jgi:predicted ATPase
VIQTLAIANYRSLRHLVVPLGKLNVVTGENGSGKSNLYRALRLLSETALGGATNSLAREGGLGSVLWAGPSTITGAMRRGEAPVQGQGVRDEPVNLRLGFATGEFGYAIDFGLPIPTSSMFTKDPEIKRECIWHGPRCRPAATLVDRHGPIVRVRDGSELVTVAGDLAPHDSLFTSVADPRLVPELITLRDEIRSWRFYDHFRTDRDAPARQLQVGTRTVALSHDGHDLAAAWQTICEMGDAEALTRAVDDAFPGAQVQVVSYAGQFGVELAQDGLLRPLSQAELSDGTLRYLLLIAALLTPRPPSLLVLNEPETSLHEDLIPALARLIVLAAERTQVWVVSHSRALTLALRAEGADAAMVLQKILGETALQGRGRLEQPMWDWPKR